MGWLVESEHKEMFELIEADSAWAIAMLELPSNAASWVGFISAVLVPSRLVQPPLERKRNENV